MKIAQAFGENCWKKGVGSTAAIAARVLACRSAMYWIWVRPSARAPRRPRWPPTSVCRPRVAHGHLLGADPAGDVLGDGQALEGHPSREEDVDDHQGLMRGRMDENVVGCDVRAVEGQFEQLAADLQNVLVVEGHRGRRPVRVIVAQQQAEVLGLPNADHVRAEQGRGADVIGV